MALTGHYINKDWERKMVVLDCIPANESHTAENVAQILRDAFDTWNLHNRCHLVLRDNATNLVNALKINGTDSFGCFLHTLNLIVQHSVFKQKSVEEMLERAQKLAKYFRLKKPEKRLKQAQSQQNIAQKQLLLAEPTRWNTYYFQIKRQLEQRHAVTLAVSWLNESEANARKPPKIPESDWTLIENVLLLLEPFYTTTILSEKEDSCISEVIPHVKKLISRITKVSFIGTKTTDCSKMKNEILAQISNYFDGTDSREHFEHVEKTECCFLATLLDPKFKNSGFRSRANARWAIERVEQILNEQESAPTSPNTSISEAPSSTSYFSDILDLTPVRTYSDEMAPRDKNEKMVYDYLKEPANADVDTLKYWKINQKRFPKLAKLARKYLSAPSGSVASERTFKTAKSISEGDRAKLLPENVEHLLFCKYNLRAVNHSY